MPVTAGAAQECSGCSGCSGRQRPGGAESTVARLQDSSLTCWFVLVARLGTRTCGREADRSSRDQCRARGPERPLGEYLGIPIAVPPSELLGLRSSPVFLVDEGAPHLMHPPGPRRRRDPRRGESDRWTRHAHDARRRARDHGRAAAAQRRPGPTSASVQLVRHEGDPRGPTPRSSPSSTGWRRRNRSSSPWPNEFASPRPTTETAGCAARDRRGLL